MTPGARAAPAGPGVEDGVEGGVRRAAVSSVHRGAKRGARQIKGLARGGVGRLRAERRAQGQERAGVVARGEGVEHGDDVIGEDRVRRARGRERQARRAGRDLGRVRVDEAVVLGRRRELVDGVGVDADEGRDEAAEEPDADEGVLATLAAEAQGVEVEAQARRRSHRRRAAAGRQRSFRRSHRRRAAAGRQRSRSRRRRAAAGRQEGQRRRDEQEEKQRAPHRCGEDHRLPLHRHFIERSSSAT